MKFNKNHLLLSLFLFSFASSESMQWNSFRDYFSRNNLIVAGSCVAVGFAGYKLYQYGQEYLENRIIDEAVDAIQTGLTPVYSLQNLPAQEHENILRKKARLINIRKRIMTKLAARINDAPNPLSNQHQAIIKKDLRLAKGTFIAIDAVRTENPYENAYEIASTIDEIIENKIISSIILVTKPDNECSAKELNEKKEKEARKAKIVAKLQEKALNIAEKAILRSVIGLAILLNGIN